MAATSLKKQKSSAEPSMPPSDDGAARLGSHIRRLRLRLGFSLRGLAKMSGISPSFLSAIERGRETAALKSLRAIAASMNVPLFAILGGGEDNAPALNRAADRPRLKFSDSLVEYEVLLLDASRDAQIYIGHLAAGAANTSNPVGHGAPSEECLFILSGRVTVRLKDKKLALEKFDCLNFDGEIPHQIIADKSGPASFLSITTGTFIAWRKLAPGGKSTEKGTKAAPDTIG